MESGDSGIEADFRLGEFGVPGEGDTDNIELLCGIVLRRVML